MKILIACAGKKGATSELAQAMAKTIRETDSGNGGEEPVVVDLRKNSRVEVAGYDRVIIGGAVYMGTVHKAVGEFCRNHLEELLQRPVALYLSALREDDLTGTFDRSFPEKLRSHAVEEVWLGGRIRFAEHNILVRGMLRKIMARHDDMDTLRWDEARRLATAVVQ